MVDLAGNFLDVDEIDEAVHPSFTHDGSDELQIDLIRAGLPTSPVDKLYTLATPCYDACAVCNQRKDEAMRALPKTMQFHLNGKVSR